MHVLKHLFHYILKRKYLSLGVIICIFIAQIAELAIPLIVGSTIDRILYSIEKDQFEINIVILGVGFIIVVSILRAITYFFARWIGFLQGEGVIFDIRQDLFIKYENSSLSFFDKHHTGDLMSRATTDLEPINEFLVWGQRILLQAFLTYIGIYLILLIIDIRLFILIVIVTPLLFVLSYLISTKLGPLFFDIRTQYGKLTTVIQENISGMQIVKAFNQEEHEKEKFNKENFEYMSLRAYAFKIRSIFLPLILLIVNLLVAILVFAGGYLVIQDEITLGLLITLFTYFTMLAMPTRFLAFSLIMFQRVSAAGNRVFSLIGFPTDLRKVNDGIILSDNITPIIIFEDVSFSYDRKKTILSHISIEINAGEKIAIIGPTGSGKSAIISLIPRFYDVNEGNIRVKDNHGKIYDLMELELKSWREKIGFVHQEPFLFGRTIAENVAFGEFEKNTEQIEEVLSIAQLGDYISHLPDGINTIIGERGVTLSGGQKQRIAIARMLLKRKPIMILDDATSSLDISTEADFQKAFEEYLSNSPIKHTVIFVSQRLSTLKMVDRIILMNRGKIIEIGNHEELLEKGHIYPLLWKTQEAGMVDIKLTLEKIIQEKTLDE